MRVIFSPSSLRDLTAIGDYIALENRRRARSFVAELRVACRSLSSDSLRYPLQPRWPGIRRMPIGSYLILYGVSNEAVRIVRVLHSARDMDDLIL